MSFYSCIALALTTWVLLFGSCVLADDRPLPPYVRGKGVYQWMLTERERDRGLSYLGNAERLRVKLQDHINGKPLKITTIGGSITAGQGCPDAPSWPVYLTNYLQDNLEPGQANITGHMGAVGGTMSTYMVLCYNMHVPRDSDIVFVEYTVNDPQAPMPHFVNDFRTGFERLLRKLLNYPNKPAVVLVHSFQYFAPNVKDLGRGVYWHSAEREFGEFALYYGLPQISLKAATYQLMVQGVTGFHVDGPRLPDLTGLKGKAFYYDEVHPDGNTGSRALAELVIHLLVRVRAGLKERPLSAEDTKAAEAPLPRPMIPGNLESAGDRCFIGQHFVSAVIRKDDAWEWIDESKGHMRPKWGYISTKVGSSIEVKVDTRTSTQGTAEVLLELAYLRSYEHMGIASVKCASGCTCAETQFDGHYPQEKNSQLYLHNFHTSQHEACVIAITVLDATKSGEHKVKVAGIMVSEQSTGGVQNYMAVEYVHDISLRAKDGIFEVNNHAR